MREVNVGPGDDDDNAAGDGGHGGSSGHGGKAGHGQGGYGQGGHGQGGYGQGGNGQSGAGNGGSGDGGGSCGGGAGGPGGPWACVDEDVPPPSSSLVTFQLQVIDAVDRAPRTDARVRLCSRFQQTCTDPLGDPVQVDASGKATLLMPEYFDGYLEVFGPDGPEVDDPTFVRTTVFLPPREITQGSSGRGIAVFDKQTMASLATLGGGSFDDETGLVTLTTLDCEGHTAAFIRYELLTSSLATDKTSPFYTIDRLPTPLGGQTDLSGTGGFTNLLPGLASFSASLLSSSAPPLPITDEAGTAAYVRAGWSTQVYVAP